MIDKAVEISVNGAVVMANEGEPLAAALIASGQWVVRRARSGEPRGPFCLIGACQECVLSVDGQRTVRSCLTPVAADMRVTLES
jgi:predicted molibdopterin-dependent oxidoreductase YjgC